MRIMSYRRLLAMAPLALAIVPAAFAAPAPVSAPAVSAIGVPSYDPRLEAVVVPVAGLPPELSSEVVVTPPIYRLKVKGRAGFVGRRQGGAGRNPALTGWVATPGDAGVQVSLVFRSRLAPVSVSWDKQRHALVLVPLYPGKQAPLHGLPLFASAPPIKTYSPRPRPTPSVSVAPLPSPKPSPVPSPAPTPRPVPSPSATPGWETRGAVSMMYNWVDYTEYNPNGDLLVQLQNGRMLGGRYGVRFAPPEPWRSRLTPKDVSPDWHFSPYWQTDLTAYSFSYVLSDRNLPFSHRFREDSRLEYSLMRELTRNHLWSDVGLGYWGRLENSYNTGVPPVLSQAFTFNRLFHAPMARFSVSVPPEEVKIGGVPGWRLFAELDYSPIIFTALDKGLPGLPPLSWSRTRLGIERDWGPFRLSFSDTTWLMTGYQFEERFHMPTLMLTWETYLP
jgi:hypothetical protein